MMEHDEKSIHLPRYCKRERRRELSGTGQNVNNIVRRHRRKGKCPSTYVCSRCRHHGIISIKKGHLTCPFMICTCEKCDVYEEKRRIENETALEKRTEKLKESSNNSAEAISDDAHDIKNKLLSPEAKVIIQLINALAINPVSFAPPDDFDYKALAALFNNPSVVLPDWMIPELPNIHQLVNEAMQRYPNVTVKVLSFADIMPVNIALS